MSGIGRPDVSLSGNMAQRDPRRELTEGKRGHAMRQDASLSPADGGDRFDRRSREDIQKAALFRRKIDDARHQAGLDDDKPADTDADTRLLAQSGTLAAPLGLAQVAPVPATTGPGPSADVRLQGLVDHISLCVEQALRADLRGAPIQLKLQLQLDGKPHDMPGLTISMTADALDVTLTRSGQDASPILAAAAQELADRLRLRFSRRIVRIHDAGPAVAEAVGGLQALAALLQGQRGGPL